MFLKNEEKVYQRAEEGVVMKTLVHGEKTLMAEFKLEKGACLPLHSHPHEQTGYLVAGRISLSIGEKSVDALPGDSWCIPGRVEHSAYAKEGSVVVEVFSPVREEYLP